MPVHRENTTGGHSEKAAICNPRRQLSPDTHAASILILGFKAPELWEHKFLSFKPPSLWYFLWQPELAKMLSHWSNPFFLLTSPSGIREERPDCWLSPFLSHFQLSVPDLRLSTHFSHEVHSICCHSSPLLWRMLTSKPFSPSPGASVHTRMFLFPLSLASTFEGFSIYDKDLSNILPLFIPMSSISTSPALDFVKQRYCISKIADLKMFLPCFSVLPLNLHLDLQPLSGLPVFPVYYHTLLALYPAWLFIKIKFIVL